ncbi:MAG: DUF3373 domain-containing protein [Proteobacteria bacterium]|nr:DUF3373 domain-containing protein [Pseudomonadota bacterium]MBU1715017.1 DUF3373 domain-containing protein [Pseudomonadota bacterium]
MKRRYFFLLLFVIYLNQPCVCLGETELAGQNHLSLSVTGDVHGGINYSDNDSNTVFPVSMRLQFGIRAGKDFELIGRVNTGKIFELKIGDDDKFMIDRLFFCWQSIVETPLSFRMGRLPTAGLISSDNLRLGLDEPDAELLSYTNIALDGFGLGYRFRQTDWSEKFSLYVARQYDWGYEGGDRRTFTEDTEIYGLHLTARNRRGAIFVFQTFAFKDIYNIPENVTFVNPLEFARWENDNSYYDPLNSSMNLILDRTDLGNIYHTSMLFSMTGSRLKYFLALSWSRTDAKAVDELGTSLLGSWWDEPEDKDGYSVYTGMRYDFDDSRFKLGLEFNYGSKNWLALDSKLATRGYVTELYSIYDLQVSSLSARVTNSFLRLGYQYYDYQYTGSGFWLGKPEKIDDLANDPLLVQFYNPADHDHSVYMAADFYF